MTVKTFLHIFTEDAQGYTNDLTYRIADLAFATAQDIPTPTLINAVVSALFGNSNKPSDQIVTGYSIEVKQDTPEVTGGNGNSATAIAARARNQVEDLNWMFSIPGLNKAAVIFDPVNPNSISTSGPGTLWSDLRTALFALSAQDPKPPSPTVPGTAELIQAVTQFNGRRGPKRSR